MNNTINARPVQETCIKIIRSIAEEVCLHPDKIKVSQDFFDEHTIDVQVHAGDMGKLMGEKGAHKRAIVDVVNQLSAKHKTSIMVRFLEPEPGPKERYPDFVVKEPWDGSSVVALAKDISEAMLNFPAEVVLHDGKRPEDIGKSKIEVLVSPKEHPKMLESLNVKVAPLFRGIGRVNGRYLSISFRPDPAYKHDDQGAVPDWNPENWR